MLTAQRPEAHVGTPPDRKYWGSYVGFVRDTDDPERRGRVRFYIPEVAGDEDTSDTWSDWALPKMPLAGFDTGALMVPPAPSEQTRNDDSGNDKNPLRRVAYWIEFRHGDPRFPIYTGGFWYGEGDIPNYTPPMSDVDNGGDESMLPPNGTAKTRLVDFDADGELTEATPATEPLPSGEPRYPRNRFYKSPSGHLIEVDDTPDRERVKVYHRAGCYLEMTPDGSLITKVTGKRYGYVSDDEIRHVVGSVKEVFDREHHVQVAGNSTEIYRGTRRIYEEKTVTRIAKGNVSEQINGTHLTQAGAIDYQAVADLILTSGQGFQAGGINATILGAESAQIVCPAGVKLVGLASPAAAVQPIVGGLDLFAGIEALTGAWGKIAATLSAATGVYLNTKAPGSPEYIWLTAVTAYLGAIAGILEAFGEAVVFSYTTHRVTKV